MWQPDICSNNCFKCFGAFNPIFRKHHCRKCGQIFCDSCTNKFDGERHCSSCIADLKFQAEAGIQEVYWQKDSHCHNCNACKVPFSIFKRKHHCRCCGNIFCDACSSRKFLDLRHCDTCFNNKVSKKQKKVVSFSGLDSVHVFHQYPPEIHRPDFETEGLKKMSEISDRIDDIIRHIDSNFIALHSRSQHYFSDSAGGVNKSMHTLKRKLSYLNLTASEFFKILEKVAFLRQGVFKEKFKSELLRLYKKIPDLSMLQSKDCFNLYSQELTNYLSSFKNLGGVMKISEDDH